MAWLVVMGVSGCGKSRVGALVAEALRLPLVEGDEFHSAQNRARMRQGVPLTDEDRAGWLAALGEQLQARSAGGVLTCSALKRDYREQLRAAARGLRFAWLDLDAAAAEARVASRPSHFFPPGLVATQYEALESPLGEPGVLRLDALQAPESVAARIVQWMKDGASP